MQLYLFATIRATHQDSLQNKLCPVKVLQTRPHAGSLLYILQFELTRSDAAGMLGSIKVKIRHITCSPCSIWISRQASVQNIPGQTTGRVPCLGRLRHQRCHAGPHGQSLQLNSLKADSGQDNLARPLAGSMAQADGSINVLR